MLDLERFFPTFNFCLSTTFLEHYSKQKQQLVLTGGGKGLLGSGRLQDVLSKASISNRFSGKGHILKRENFDVTFCPFIM